MKRIAKFGTAAAAAMLASLLCMPVQAQQTGSGTTTGATTGNGTASTTGSATGTASTDTGRHAKSGGTTHHHAHARTHANAHGQHHMDGMMSQGESAYRAELRQCVEGPANSRDRCIDQAIQHHGG
jgi:hypothetical protein